RPASTPPVNCRARACRRGGLTTGGAIVATRARLSVLLFRLGDGLPDLGTAVGTFIDEVDLRHAPVRLDVSHIHRKQPDAAGADNRGRLKEFVMLDISWHVALPRKAE